PHRIEPGAGRQPVRLGCVVAASAEPEHGGGGEGGGACEHDRGPIKPGGPRLSLRVLARTPPVPVRNQARSHAFTGAAGAASGLRRACLGRDRARRPVSSWSLGTSFKACTKSTERCGAHPTTVRASSSSSYSSC